MKWTLLRKIYYRFIQIKEKRRQNIRISFLQSRGVGGLKDCFVTANSSFGGKNNIGPNCVLKSTNVGYATYIRSDCYFEQTNIGKYCSIANNVRVTAGNHPTSKWVSTHPAFYSKMMVDQFGYVEEQLYEEFKFADPEKRKFVCVGHDVWIGAEVTILEGVTIGDGAIIASKAMVTKDVAPYEIVGGVPAKHIRWRFEKEDRDYLLKLRWWDKSEEWIKENATLFSNIRKMREKYEQ